MAGLIDYESAPFLTVGDTDSATLRFCCAGAGGQRWIL